MVNVLIEENGIVSTRAMCAELCQSRTNFMHRRGDAEGTVGQDCEGGVWGLADDLSIPLAVLTREADDTFVDPPCVYRAQPPGGRRENAGAFSYVPFDELLGWLDRSEVWPPFALVEFVPGHYSPFLFATKR